jgi:hypothetical protein
LRGQTYSGVGWPEGATIHENALKRRTALAEYKATNLPSTYVGAQDHETDPEEVRLNVGDTVEFGICALLRWNDTALRMLRAIAICVLSLKTHSRSDGVSTGKRVSRH